MNNNFILNRIQFKTVESDSELEKKANLKLIEILALAPRGACALGIVERKGNAYISSIVVKSQFRSFSKQAVGVNLKSTTNQVLDKLESQLFDWWFGGGTHGVPLLN